MSVLFLTGAAGFIGSNFLRLMIREKQFDRIIVYDSLTYAGCRENLSITADNVSIMVSDLLDLGSLSAAMDGAGVTHVVHFAAETHVDRSISEPSRFVMTNVVGTNNLLYATGRLAPGLKKFVYVSTDEVYGPKLEGLSVETDQVLPSSPYSASKAGGEAMCHAYFVTYKMPIVVTRGTNTFGPNQHEEKLIPLTVKRVMANQPVPIYGDGQQMRDWISVNDHCRAVWRVMVDGVPGEIYNVGSRNVLSNMTVVGLVMDIIRKSGGPTGQIKHVADRPGHDRRYAVDPSKMERLDWSPNQFSFVDTVQALMHR